MSGFNHGGPGSPSANDTSPAQVLWEKVKEGAMMAGVATKIAATKAKLNADMLLIDREVIARKHRFGVDLYEHVGPLSQTAEFYAASDDLTELLRGPLILAQKEIRAYEGKRVKIRELQAQADVKRAAAFPTKAETIGEQIKNVGVSAMLAGPEAKLKAELAVADRQILWFKQNFGMEMYSVFMEAEDTRNYLPTDRTVRSLYDQTRNDVSDLEQKKMAKQKELNDLDGIPTPGYNPEEPHPPRGDVHRAPYNGSHGSATGDYLTGGSSGGGGFPNQQQPQAMATPAYQPSMSSGSLGSFENSSNNNNPGAGNNNNNNVNSDPFSLNQFQPNNTNSMLSSVPPQSQQQQQNDDLLL